MEVKVECSCGTRYKFDVEPVNGVMPVGVSCPSCGVDGTQSANAVIQHALAVQSASVGAPAVVADRPRIRLNIPAPGGPQQPAAHEPLAAVAAPVGAPAPVRPVPRTALGPAQPAAEAGKGRFGMGILGAVLGTLLGVGIWLGIFYATDLGSKSFIKLFCIGVGITAGFGARLLSKDEGSHDLGYITAAIALVGIFAAQYTIAKEQTIGRYKKVVGAIYEEQVEYAKKALKVIPTGSDKEIREFLAKESVEDGERVKPAEISADDVQYFREKQLPELRELASGKKTKTEYNKEFGTEEIEENAGFKLFLAIKGLGAFTFGAMIVALGTAFKIAGSNA
jgi:hypothetical protein